MQKFLVMYIFLPNLSKTDFKGTIRHLKWHESYENGILVQMKNERLSSVVSTTSMLTSSGPLLQPPTLAEAKKYMKNDKQLDVSVVIWHEAERSKEQPLILEASDSTSSGGCGEVGCNQKGCQGYQQGHNLIDRDEIITCSVYEV